MSDQHAAREAPTGTLRAMIATEAEHIRASTRDLIARLGRQRLLAIALLLVLIASPWPPLTLVVLAAYAAVTIRRPGLTVAFLPLTAPFAYWPKDLYRVTFPVVELLFLIAVGATVLRMAFRWRQQAASGLGAATLLDVWDEAKRTLREPFGLQAAALALIATFSLLTVADPAHRHESLREWRTIVIEPLIYFFLARHWLRARAPRTIAITAFLTGATLVAALGVGQVLTGQQVVMAGGVPRATSVYMHPNALALYLLRALPFALALLVLSRAPRRERALFIALPILAVGLMLTFSRGAFIGLAAALAVLGLAAGRRAARASLLAAALGGMALLALARTRFDTGSLELRGLIWRSTLAMLRDHPAFGVGLDQFYYLYTPRYISPVAWGERFTSHPHNLFLDFWVRLGIMGLAWVAWILCGLSARVVRGWRTAGEDDRPILVAAALAGVAAFVHGLIDNFYFLIDLAFIWWFLLALIQVVTDEEAQPEPESLVEQTEGW